MARSWGTNLGIADPSLLTLATDATCTAGAATTVLAWGTSPLLKASAGGGFFAYVSGVLTIVLGATPPSALEILLNLATAGLADTFIIEPGLLLALAEIMVPFVLVSPTSSTHWYPTGDNPQVQVQPTGQAVTCKAVGTRGFAVLQQGA